MKYVVTFLIVFILIYLFYLFFVILRKDQLKKFKNNTSLRYLVKVYKLNINKLNIKKIANIIGIANSFIIAFTYTIVLLIDGFINQMLMAIGVFILLQLFIYHIIGISLKKKS